jgi:hypothetical protein
VPRLRQVPRDEAHPNARRLYELLFGERDPVASPGTATGTPGNWWTVFAGVPGLLRPRRRSASAFYRSADRKLSPQLRELGQLRAGWARQSRSCSPSTARPHARSGCRGEGERSGPVPPGRPRRVSRRPSEPCSPTPTVSCSTAAASPDGVFAALQRRPRRDRDPRAHLRHVYLRPARGDMPRALAPRVRRRRHPITEWRLPPARRPHAMAVVDRAAE